MRAQSALHDRAAVVYDAAVALVLATSAWTGGDSPV